MLLSFAVAFSCLLQPGTAGDASVPPPLAALADSERAFAAAARLKGVRDAFLEYFDETAIVFTPAPENAPLRLRRRPALPFSVLELTWEPRMGDVSSAGDMGWLTGPATMIDHRQTPALNAPENYLSVWRSRPDGSWRVILDIGAATPGPVTFAPGFQRMPVDSRYTGALSEGDGGLAAADRALNDALASGAAAAAIEGALAPEARLHRNEVQPIVGRAKAALWLAGRAGRLHAATLKSEAARSGDLGYTHGAYREDPAAATGEAEVGAYVRVWTRDASGRWQVVVDVTRPGP